MKIKFIGYGTACRIGDVIYINKSLKSYPDVYNSILEHEKAHTSGFSMKDLMLDLKNPYLKGKKLRYWGFMLKHPLSFTEFLPFGIYDGRFVINPVNLAFYGVILISIGGQLWFLS